MTADLMGIVNFLQFRGCVRVRADRRAAVGNVNRAARGKAAAALRAFKIKHPPAAIIGMRWDLDGFIAFFVDQRGPQNGRIGMTRRVGDAAGQTHFDDLAQVHNSHLVADELYDP